MNKKTTVFTKDGAMVTIQCATVEQHSSCDDGQRISVYDEKQECIAKFFNIQGYYIEDNI